MSVRGFVALVVGLCALSSVQAVGVADTDKSALLHELMERTGLKAQILQFPDIIKSGVEVAVIDSGADYQAAAAIAEIIDYEIEPSRVIDEVGAQLDENLSETDLHSLLNWLNSPLGQKIARLENTVSSSAVEEQAVGNREQERASPVGPDRERLYRRLDQAIRATEATVQMTLNAQTAVATAILSTSDDAESPPPSWIREQIESQRFQLRGLVTQQVYTSFVDTYQTLSAAELESYIRQASTPSGRRYTAAVIEALNQSLTASFERVGARMGSELLS